MGKGNKILLHLALFITASYFLFVGLVKAESFLVPLLTAMVLAFLILPITNRLEKWGLNKALATLASTLILLIVAAGFTTILFLQVKSLS